MRHKNTWILKLNHKQWISETTWNKTEQRKQIELNILNAKTSIEKEELNRTYKTLDKEVNSLARHDKRQYLKSVAEAAQKSDLRELYRITRALSGNFKTITDLPIQTKNGITLTSQKDISNRWVEHFKELLNGRAPTEKFTFNHITSTEDPNIELGPITKTEIITAIKTIKNNKAPRLDGISGELLKTKESTSINRLVHLYNNMRNQEKIPKDWKTGVIIKIPKKRKLEWMSKLERNNITTNTIQNVLHYYTK